MLNEDLIEMALIDHLTGQGFTFHHGPDIAPDSDNPRRKNFDSVVLENALKLLRNLIQEYHHPQLQRHIKSIELRHRDIMENNELFHTYLTNGVPVEYTKDGAAKGVNVDLIDIENQKTIPFGRSISL